MYSCSITLTPYNYCSDMMWQGASRSLSLRLGLLFTIRMLMSCKTVLGNDCPLTSVENLNDLYCRELIGIYTISTGAIYTVVWQLSVSLLCMLSSIHTWVDYHDFVFYLSSCIQWWWQYSGPGDDLLDGSGIQIDSCTSIAVYATYHRPSGLKEVLGYEVKLNCTQVSF